MALNKNHRTLAQYLAATVDRGESIGILDGLEDVNFKLPMELTGEHYFLIGCTPLHLTYFSRNSNDLKKLIKRGADLTVKNGYGRTVLYSSLHSNCVYSQEKNYILRDKVATNPYISAILSAHAKHNIFEDPSYDENGISHFHIACVTNHVTAVSTFLKGGVSANKPIKINSNLLPGYTPLHIAAWYGALEIAEILLKHGADISYKDVKGMTALDLLVDRNMKIMNSLDPEKPTMYKKLKLDIDTNEEIINMILAKNDAHDFIDLSPLQIACTMQEPSRAKELLAIADLQYSVSTDSTMWPGYTALHFAAHFSLNTVKLLLKKGANIFAKDAKKVTPFELCVVKYKIKDICYLIVNHQSLNNIKFSDKKTKLSSFVLAMHNEIKFRSFIRKVSDINIYIPFDSPLWPGYTPFHLVIAFLEKEEETLENFIENTDYYYPSNEEWRKAEGESISDEKADGGKGEKLRMKLNLEDVKLCLQKGVDVTAQDIQGRTPLHLAFRLQSKTLVDLLLNTQKRAFNPVDDEGLSHLHIAVASGNELLTKVLLKAHENHINKSVKFGFHWRVEEYDEEKKKYVRKRINVNAGSTALHIAVARYNQRITKLLINSGADLYARDDYDLTPIHLMMSFPDGLDTYTYGFEYILEAIEDLEDRVAESTGLSHLHVACWFGCKKLVENLLDRGVVNVESTITAVDFLPFLKPFDKMRPLDLAFLCMWLEIIELLIDRGVEISLCGSIRDDLDEEKSNEFINKLWQNTAFRQRLEREIGVTLLHFACSALNVDVVKEAINQGSDVNARTHEDSPLWPGYTPLHVLATAPRPDDERLVLLVKLLLSHGADVTLKNAEQDTPIHQFHNTIRSKDKYLLMCCIDVHQQIVELLLEAQQDFNVNPENRMGISHFHLACMKDCEKLVKQLLDHGVDVNSQVDYLDYAHDGGCSPLHLAVINWSEKSCDLLLERATDLRLVDRLGNTALHHAVDRSSFELAERMMSAGADVMAVNVFGETPFEMLLNSGEVPAEMIETIIMNKGIPTNSFNPVSEEGYLAKAFSHNVVSVRGGVKTWPVFDVMMARYDLTVLDDMGRNAIHNLVSYKGNRHHGLSRDSIIKKCTLTIHRLARMGSNVDHQDNKGRTPLHMATQMGNGNGIIALLDCGANVNVTDEKQKSALAYLLEYGEEEVHEARQYMWIFYAFLSRYCSYGFQLSKMNVELYRKIGSICVLNREYKYEMPPLDEEIEKLKEWQVGSLSMKLHDLLSNEGVAAYTMMKRDYRLAVDEIFQSDRLRNEVPGSTGLLLLRYNQARIDFQTRLTLIEPAKVSLDILARRRIHDVCALVILGFLTVKELQNMISSVIDME